MNDQQHHESMEHLLAYVKTMNLLRKVMEKK